MSLNKQILLIEDDMLTSRMMNGILSKAGFAITCAYDGITGLELFKKIRFAVTIIDLGLPSLSGDFLIDEIKKYDTNAVIIVQSADSDQNTIISTMKKGVLDYIIKPIDFSELPQKIGKACEYSNLLWIQTEKEREEKRRIQEELEWMKWKHEHSTTADFKEAKIENSLFYFLKTYFSQGSGIGVIISMIKMMLYKPTIEDDKYMIGEDLMELLRDNLIIVDRTLNTFAELDYIITNPISLEPTKCMDIYQILEKAKTEASKYLHLKGHTISLSSFQDHFNNFKAMIHGEYLHQVFHEITMNALKFSNSNSNITVIMSLNLPNKLEILFINSPLLDKLETLPSNFETIIFDPFYRLNNVLHESYHTLDFGLGLTLVDKILKKHGGTISVSKIKDHTNFSSINPELKLNFSITLPIYPI